MALTLQICFQLAAVHQRLLQKLLINAATNARAPPGTEQTPANDSRLCALAGSAETISRGVAISQQQ